MADTSFEIELVNIPQPVTYPDRLSRFGIKQSKRLPKELWLFRPQLATQQAQLRVQATVS